MKLLPAEPAPNQRCVLLHRGGTRPFVATGFVCTEHLAELRDLLADVLDLWRELPYSQLALARPGDRNQPDGSKRGKVPDAPAPVNLTAIALTSTQTAPLGSVAVDVYRNGARLQSNGPEVPEVWAVLTRWAGQVAADRNTAMAGGGVAALIEALRTHVAWIAGQPWLLDFELELRACRRALAAAVGDDPAPPPFCDCPHCGTILWTDLARSVIRLRRAGQDPAEATGRRDRVACPTCRASWDGSNGLARLLHIVRDEQRRRQATA